MYVIVADTLAGGLGAAAHEHKRALESVGLTVTLVADGITPQVPATPPAISDLVGCVRYSWSLSRYLRSRPDVSRLYVHGVRSAALARLCTSTKEIRIFAHGYGLRPESKRGVRWLHRSALAMMPNFFSACYAVMPGFPGNWQFVPILSPSLRNHQQGVLRQRDPVRRRIVLWLGRLDRPKRPEDFIDLAAEFSISADFVVAGDGPLQLELTSRAKSLGADVIFLGSVAEPMELMEAADVLVLSSASEGVPFVIQEAMAASVPVIATDLPGTRWLLNGCGFTCKSQHEMRDTLGRWLTDAETYEAQVVSTRNRWLEIQRMMTSWPEL